MNFIDPQPDHITVHEAAALAGCSTKTVRRAVQTGQLPQRYVLGHRGPYLVFLRAEIEQWRVVAAPQRRGRPPRSAPVVPRVAPKATSLHTSLAKLQAALDGHLATARQYHVALDEHDEALTLALASLTSHIPAAPGVAIQPDAPEFVGESAE